jgi:hypothetical protein
LVLQAGLVLASASVSVAAAVAWLFWPVPPALQCARAAAVAV